MTERYDHSPSTNGPDDDCPYAWISEWLCEYVDGTMDPSMQAVFEEYMQANPELAAHVERLCRTRTLLSECGCREEAAERAKDRLHQIQSSQGRGDERSDDIERQIEEVLAGKALPEELHPEEADPDGPMTTPLSAGTVAAVASAMTLMLGVGMVAGVVLFADPATKSATASRAAPTEQAAPAASDRRASDRRASDRRASDRRASDRRASDRRAVPARALKAAMNSSEGIPSPWKAGPLPLKKMPMGLGDSAEALSSHTLVQQTGLNP